MRTGVSDVQSRRTSQGLSAGGELSQRKPSCASTATSAPAAPRASCADADTKRQKQEEALGRALRRPSLTSVREEEASVSAAAPVHALQAAGVQTGDAETTYCDDEEHREEARAPPTNLCEVRRASAHGSGQHTLLRI